ncbi:Hypothetical_protein [Hexamita inflata]|uniref:Hypothetical_protein n=1 Tax=Hexamita inflata TaxID=28002 RepID=A0AA86VIK6_9EUKA|nr:Hypothetical protein HINF_LOCUS55383 [Hexamita inflata]
MQINDSYTCVDPFIFNGSQCICQEGYILNISSCINLASQLTNTSTLVNKLDSQLVNMQQNIESMLDSLNIINSNLTEQIYQSQLTAQQLFNQSQSYILGNATLLNQQLQIYTTVLDQRIFDNVTLLNTILLTNSTNLQNMINSSVIQINSTINTLNYSINQKNVDISNNFSSINNTLAQYNNTINSLLNTVSDLQNQLVDQENAELESQLEINDFYLPELICNQNAFVQQFDISTISQTVNSSNFTLSYVYGNTQIVNNAFINVLENSLTNSFSLYNQQTYYYNIKVQIGSQSMLSGSIISDQSIKSMTNIIIQSKQGSLILTSGQLNILSRVSNGSSIRNLYVNMLISSSNNGNISLIGSQSNALNIRNYQVVGTYYSKQQMSLCVANSYQAQISITNVNFKPDVYTFGNQSSYFFACVSSSQLQIVQLVVSIGSISTSSLLTNLLSTNSNQLQYGGIISQITTSSVIIHNSVVQIFLKQTTNYLNSSGMIIGTSITTIVSTQQLCVFEQTQYTGSIVNQSGLFGMIGGKISISNTNINYSVSGSGQFSNFGTIGYLSQNCQLGSFNNIQISFASIQKSNYDNSEINIAILVGKCEASQTELNNSNIQGNVSAASNVALVGGYQNSNFTINNVILSNSRLLGQSVGTYSIGGGLFGYLNSPQNSYNTYFGLQINVQLQIVAQLNNSYSSCVIGYSSYINNLFVNQCKIQNSTIQSQSLISGYSYSSGLISYIQYSNYTIECAQILNITIQSKSQSQAISAGYIAFNNLTNATFNNIETLSCNISSISNIPIASGIVGNLTRSIVYFEITNIKNTVIYGDDQNYAVDQIQYRVSTGVLAHVSFSQISVFDIQIDSLHIQTISQQKAAVGGVTGILINSSIISQNIKVLNIQQYSNSVNNWTYFGTVNAYIEFSNDTQSEIFVKYCMMNTSQTNVAAIGAINGYILNSNVQIKSILVQYVNISVAKSQYSYAGGIIGIIQKYNVIEIQGCTIQNINIQSTSSIHGVVGFIMGFISGNSILIFDSVNIFFATSNITADTVFSSSFAGSQQSQLSSANVTIINSQIYSAQIQYQNQTQALIHFIIRPQSSALIHGLIQIQSTKSLGFSSINGVPVKNCEDVKVQYINGNNIITDNGCI